MKFLICVSLLIFINALVLYRHMDFVCPPTRDFVREPLIFVGGHESTGTGLMRVLLDAHPWVRCGAEPMIHLKLLKMRAGLNRHEILRATAAGYYPDGLDRAMAHFIHEIIISMGPPAKRLCHKLPRTLDYIVYLHRIFPEAKFIHMVRDGRAAVESTVRRGFRDDYTDKGEAYSFQQWEYATELILHGCQKIGRAYCLSVRYEHLVMDPKKVMGDVLQFLGIPWDPIVLHHETVLENITRLSDYEPSTPQVKKKIHTDSLSLWYENMADLNRTFMENIHKTSTLLRVLGYSFVGLPPNYELLPYEVPEI